MIVLHLLLLLLKIIGIVLLILLGLILLVLLVPIRYSFALDYKKGQDPHIDVKVSWFIRLLLARGSYKEKKLFYEVKVAFKRLLSSEPEEKIEKDKAQKKKLFGKKKEQGKETAGTKTPKEKEKKKNDGAKKPQPKAESKSDKAESKPDKAEEVKPETKAESLPKKETTSKPKENGKKKEAEKPKESGKKKEAEKPKESGKKKEAEKPKEIGKKKVAEKSQESAKKKGTNPSKKESFFEKRARKKEEARKQKEFREQADAMAEEEQNILDKLKAKVEMVRGYYVEYRVAELLPFVRDILISVLKHVLPRKLEGYVIYGFDDPSLTGKVTAWAAMFYPVYGKSFSLYPDFQETCFEADCKGSGKIRLGFFVWIIIKLLLNKHVRHDIILFLKR